VSRAAIDIVNLPKLEPIAAPAATPSAGAGPSFQDMLQQAGRRTSDSEAARRNRDGEDRRRADETRSRGADDDGRRVERHDDATTTKPAAERDATDDSSIDEPQATDEPNETETDEAESISSDASIVVAAVAVSEPIDARPIAEATEVAPTAIETGDQIAKAKPAAEMPSQAQAANVKSSPVDDAVDATVVADADVVTVAAPTDDITAADAGRTIAPQITEGDNVETTRTTPDATTEIAATPVVDAKAQAAAAAQATEAATQAVAKAAAGTVDPTTTTPAAPQAVADADVSQSDEKKDSSHREKNERVGEAKSATPANEVAAATTKPAPVAAAAVDAAAASASTMAAEQLQETAKQPTDGDVRTSRSERSPVAAEAPATTRSREHAGATTDAKTGEVALSQADRVRLVQRVARAVQTAQDRGGELKLRLSPPELGSLRLQVRLVDGALSARIEAETSAARQVISDNLPALRERLAEQNIRVERFDVDLSNNGNGGASQMPERQQRDLGDSADRGGPHRPQRSAGAESTTALDAGRHAGSLTPDGRLNVVV